MATAESRVPSRRAPRLALSVALLLSPAVALTTMACSGGGSSHEAAEPDGSESDATGNSEPDATSDGPGADSTSHDSGRHHAEAGDEEGGAETGPVDSGTYDVSYPYSYDAGADCALGMMGEPVELACTGLYEDFASKTIAADVVAYDPGLHLWSDGAQKNRWISLPPGQKIDTSNMDEWTFPVGTKIWKEFSLGGTDASPGTRIETRLLWKQAASTWYRTTYEWTPDGEKSATELINGKLNVRGTGYEIPSQFECNDCHNGRIDGVMGFEAVSLSSPGATGLTMADLVAQNLVTVPPAAPIVVPGDPVESTALAYLHANCGTSCHNSGMGEAEGTGFFMRLDVATLTSVETTDTWTTGWGIRTQNFNIPHVPKTYRLLACTSTASAAYYRADHRTGVDHTGGGVQMPPIDTHVVDVAGVAEIKAWIDEGCDGGGK